MQGRNPLYKSGEKENKNEPKPQTRGCFVFLLRCLLVVRLWFCGAHVCVLVLLLPCLCDWLLRLLSALLYMHAGQSSHGSLHSVVHVVVIIARSQGGGSVLTSHHLLRLPIVCSQCSFVAGSHDIHASQFVFYSLAFVSRSPSLLTLPLL